MSTATAAPKTKKKEVTKSVKKDSKKAKAIARPSRAGQPRERYDWTKLFDGKKHHLEVGKQIDSVKNFKCAAYMKAKRLNLHLEFVVAEDQKSLGMVAKKATKKKAAPKKDK